MMILVTTLCLAAAVNAVSDEDWYYAEIFAKMRAFPLTAGAYTNDNNALRACINRAAQGGQVETKGIIEAPCEYDKEKYTCKAYTALLKLPKPAKPAIAIVFRGTDQGFPQLWREAWKSVSFLEERQIDWVKEGSVSSYFNTSFTRLWEKGLEKQFLALLKKQPDSDIWITGHSLGGAMATLAASWLTSLSELKNKVKGKIKLVTFGAPRVGDKKFSDDLEKSVDYIYRITHGRDPVPHIPKINYFHAGKEIYYKNGMTYRTEPCDVAKDKGNCFVTCAKSEDKNCAQSVWTMVFITGDHTTYYVLPNPKKLKTISEWGDGGCPIEPIK